MNREYTNITKSICNKFYILNILLNKFEWVGCAEKLLSLSTTKVEVLHFSCTHTPYSNVANYLKVYGTRFYFSYCTQKRGEVARKNVQLFYECQNRYSSCYNRHY